MGSILALAGVSSYLDALVKSVVGRIALDGTGDVGKRMDSDGPGRKPTVSDEEILAVFENAEDPVLKAGEVADQLPIGRRAVYDRLRELEERGTLRSKKTGARSAVWWYPGHTETADGG